MADDPTQPLDEARRLLDSGEPDAATAIAEPLTRHSDPDVAGEAWLTIGTARYRTDDEPGALDGLALRSRDRRPQCLARMAERRRAARPRRRSRGCRRRVPRGRSPRAPAERGAIANRIAWLLKETGHDFAARRQFNRARGAYAAHTPYVTYAIIAICVVLFIADAILSSGATLTGGLFGGGVGPIGERNLINAFAVADGEWWVIFTSAFIHLSPIHLAFNMFVLYQYGADRRADVRARRVRADLPALRGGWQRPHDPRRPRPSPRRGPPARSSASSACCSSSRGAITRCSGARRG